MKRRNRVFSIGLILTLIVSMFSGLSVSAESADNRFGGSVYEVFNNVASSWEEAEELCESLGGHLATISSEEENNFVFSVMKNAGYSSAFFGFSDSKVEGTWVWVTGEPIQYTNWYPGEPNDYDKIEDYGMYYYEHGNSMWNDSYFSSAPTFICEWDSEAAYEQYQNYLKTGNGSNRYKLFDGVAASWEEAEEYCESLGGHLATITSLEENYYVYMVMKEAGYSSAYFGFTDVAKEGTWVWITGEPVLYTNWHSAEPSNDYGTEHYGMFYAKFADSTWNDGDFGGKTQNGGIAFICEWDDLSPQVNRNVPDGYDFLKDSYGFANFGDRISKEYFTTLYGYEKGTALYKKQNKQSGMCFGMAYTTAAILNHLPDCSKISTLDDSLFSYKYCDSIREIKNINVDFWDFLDFSGNTTNVISSALPIGNNVISIEDYIKYAFIYQFSKTVTEKSVWCSNANDIFRLVKQYTDNNMIGVTIGMSNGNTKAGHRVLAVGYEGNDILIDDPNNTKDYEKLTVYSDGTWKYSGLNGWDSTTCDIRYNLDYSMPYQLLLTGKTTKVAAQYITDTASIQETYLDGMDVLDNDSNLLYVGAEKFAMSNPNAVEVCTVEAGNEESEKGKFYWISDSDTVSVAGIEDDSIELEFAGNNTLLSTSCNSCSEVQLSLNDYPVIYAEGVGMGECNFSIATWASSTEDLSVCLEISGLPIGDTVIAKKQEDGLQITGFADAIATLYIDDEEVNAVEISSDNEEVTLVYDDNGMSDDLSVVLPECTHTLIHHDGKAATCVEAGWKAYDTCERCEYSTYVAIEPLGHDYQAKVTEPTCIENGFTTHTCSRCGDKYTDSKTSALSHSYEDGSCTRCGEKDPDYTPDRPHSEICPSKEYSDAPDYGNWAHEGIDYCIAHELMNGVGGGLFNPDGTVTRAQLVTILYRVANQPKVTSTGTFNDVPAGKWYSDAIEWAAANKIVNGVGEGKFDPMGNITREQIATILYRYEGGPKINGTLNAFPDNGSVHSYAVDALVWATDEGLINGIKSGGVTSLAPLNNATRAQIASIIMRYLES